MSRRRPDVERPWWPQAERLRRARLFAGIETQPEMAEILGVSRAQLNAWESGTQRISLVVTRAYAQVTGFDVDWLLNGDADGVVIDVAGGSKRHGLRGEGSNLQPTDREYLSHHEVAPTLAVGEAA